ncbi:MAG TPA: class I SAM-dependent methyltransferase [Blastocatellia bacterium]|nr:class I SAM-dependent methyltransferase [Blastocatellia bacterium]
MSDEPIALDAYEALAEAYAAAVDTKPHNAYCERPATLSLLPDVKGKRVLDAGCGPGVYSEWLVARGAEVVALDVSPKMVELAKQRLGRAVDVRQADLGKPLDFLDDSSFDLVLSPLVLEYIEDWAGAFSEFYRVLRPAGHLVFSVTHPLFDFLYFKSNDYYKTELVASEWRGFRPLRVKMPSFRRPLEAMINPLVAAGFRIERIVEPKPTEEFRRADPEEYEELSRQPCFLSIRARK